MQEKNRSNRILVLSFILMFIITSCTAAAGSIISIYTGIGSEKAAKESFTASEYIGKAYENYIREAEKCISRSRLPEDVLSAVPEKSFYVAAKNSFSNGIEKGDCTADTTELEKQIRKDIYGYFEDNNISVDRVIRDSADQLIIELTGIYRVNAEFALGEGLYEINRNLSKMTMIIVPLASVIAVIAVYMLIRAQKYRHRGYRYLAQSLCAGTAVTFIFVQLFYRAGRFSESYITGYYGEFVNSFLDNAHYTGLLVCGVMALIAAVSVIYSCYRTRKGRV